MRKGEIGFVIVALALITGAVSGCRPKPIAEPPPGTMTRIETAANKAEAAANKAEAAARQATDAAQRAEAAARKGEMMFTRNLRK